MSNLTDGPGSSLTIGLVNPIESNLSESTVTLEGDNTFSLGTTFNSGALYINNNNALGTGPIAVPDIASTNIVPSLAPFGGNVTLANRWGGHPRGNQHVLRRDDIGRREYDSLGQQPKRIGDRAGDGRVHFRPRPLQCRRGPRQ